MKNASTIRAAALGLLMLTATGVGQAQDADCYSIGERVAAERGGTLAKAVPANRDGRNVCVIVVLTTPEPGQRPKRIEIVVSQ